MARSRNIKPGFFMNELLAEAPFEARLLFIGLWTLADREGRLEDRPKRIRAELFPFDSFDADPMLNRLCADGFLVRYEVSGHKFIQIENFVKHQDPHYKEKASVIPAVPGREDMILASVVTRAQRARIYERDGYKCMCCGATDGLCIDHVLPVSRGGTSDDDNLQTLCMSCNTKKGNKIDGEEKNSRQRRVNIGSNLNQRNVASPSDSLIPDSQIPDTGEIPEEANASSSSAEPTEAGQKRGRTPNTPFEEIVSLYHEVLPELPKVRVMDDERKKLMANLWKFVLTSKKSDGTPRSTNEAEALLWIRGYFERTRDNDFVMNRTARSEEHKNWRANLDYLCTSRGMKQVIEKTEAAA